MKAGIAVPKTEETNIRATASNYNARGTEAALWWLRHYETIIRFWTGFSWVWVVGVILYSIIGHLDLGHVPCTILVVGMIANIGIYFSIRTMAD